MKQRADVDRRASPVEMQGGARKPYRKPSVRFEKVFEVRALTCGKVEVTQSSCAHNRKTS